MKAAIFFANGFEESEGLIVVDMFRRAGVTIDTVSMNEDREVETSHHVHLCSDLVGKDINFQDYDILILPGGKVGTANLEANEVLKQALKEHCESGKLTCSICAAPSILGHLGLLKGKKYTCFPDFDGEFGGIYQMELVVKDGNIITGRGMGATIAFGHRILGAIVDEKNMQRLEWGMQYAGTFRTLKKPE